MELLLLLWLILAIVILSLFIVRQFYINAQLPPGPTGLPFVGYLPFILRGKPHEIFSKMAEKYGDVFSMQLGRKLVVVLNSYEVAREALVTKAHIFTGRPGTMILRKNELPGIFQSEGHILKEYKRQSIGILRDFGFGKCSLEPVIERELDYLMEIFKAFDGKPTNVSNVLRTSFANVILTLLFGKRMDFNNQTLFRLTDNLNHFLQKGQMVNMEFFVPKFILKIPFIASLLGHKFTTIYGDNILEDLQAMVARAIKDIDLEKNNTFISEWMKLNQDKESSTGHIKTDYLVQVIRSLFNAGTDTLAVTLLWTFLYLIKYPYIQNRIHTEIDDVIGKNRKPVYGDHKNMPYTDATIMEIHRIVSILPLANRCNIEQTTLKGYTIPKRSIVMTNFWAIHHCPTVHPDPFSFKPERFLTSENKINIPENYIPFSTGKRQCIGANYSKIALFMFLTSILQKFSIQNIKGATVDMDYDRCIISVPKPFCIRAIKR